MTTPAYVRRLLTATVLTLLFITGCSGSKTAVDSRLPEAFPNHSALQIRQNIQTGADTLQAYAASARVTAESPQQSGSFNAKIRQKRTDSLYMSLSLFGIEGARVLVTPDSFYFYDRRKNRLMEGAVDDAEQFLPAPVASSRVFSNMLGFIAPEATTDWTVASDSSLYYLTDPSGLRSYTIDPVRWRVVRYTKTSPDGDVIEERVFGNFDVIDGIPVAKRVLFRRPGEDVMALLNYREINLRPGNQSYDLGVGADVPRVTFPAGMP